MYLIEIVGGSALVFIALYFRLPPTARMMIRWDVDLLTPEPSLVNVLLFGVLSHALGRSILALPLPLFSPNAIKRAAEYDHSAIIELAPALMGRVVGYTLIAVVPIVALSILIKGWLYDSDGGLAA
jgi:hypothetical protein